jgi:hypothetical protein
MVLENLGAKTHLSNWNDILCPDGTYTDSHGHPGTLLPPPFPDPYTDESLVKALVDAIAAVPGSSPVILIGHSYGADSVLQVAKRSARRIDLLATLDAVGRGALRVNVTYPVPDNVAFFFNRWEEGPLPSLILEGPPPPTDFLLSGRLETRADANNQEKQNTSKTVRGNTRTNGYGFPVSLSHHDLPNDSYIQRRLWRTLAGRVFNLHVVSGTPIRAEGEMGAIRVVGFRITFSKPVDPATFTAEDVLESPSVVQAVQVVAASENQEFVIQLQPVVMATRPELETRRLVIGPNIADADSNGDLEEPLGTEDPQFNWLDEDQNGVGGEWTDRYVFEFGHRGVIDTGAIVEDVMLETLAETEALLHRPPVGQIIIHFNGALADSQAANRNNYRLVSSGMDGRFGTWDDRRIALRSVVYDADAQSVILRPRSPIAWNRVVQVRVKAAGGVTDSMGRPIDGNLDGEQGGDFTGVVARGTRLSFFERDGDKVSLSLDRGGVMEMRIMPGDADPELVVLGTEGMQSILAAQVRRSTAGNGRASIRSVTGIEGVRNQMPQTVRVRRMVADADLSADR